MWLFMAWFYWPTLLTQFFYVLIIFLSFLLILGMKSIKNTKFPNCTQNRKFLTPKIGDLYEYVNTLNCWNRTIFISSVSFRKWHLVSIQYTNLASILPNSFKKCSLTSNSSKNCKFQFIFKQFSTQSEKHHINTFIKATNKGCLQCFLAVNIKEGCSFGKLRLLVRCLKRKSG